MTALATFPAATAPPSTGAVAVRFAREQIGKPYVWGGTGPSGWDCSGLTQAAWAAAGVAIPRTTSAQILIGTPVRRSELQAGDLVFTAPGHVTLATGAGTVVNAPMPGRRVYEGPIYAFVTARRPAGSTGPVAGAVDAVAGTVKGLTAALNPLTAVQEALTGALGDVQEAGTKLAVAGAGLVLVILGAARLTGAARR